MENKSSNKNNGIKIDHIKNVLKNNLKKEDLEYSHVNDATKDNYEITSEDGSSLYFGVDGMVNEIFERVMGFMPNSSSVEVKKKCKLGGSPDGTSEPCNKGDIKNLSLKKISENSDRITTNIGYFDINDTIAPSKNDLFISHLEVNPELRGQGYFKELLNSITQEAKKRGKTKIVFDPDITQGKEYLNKLISIYKHHGFDNDSNDPSLLVKNLNENHRDDIKYGVLMAMCKIPNWNKITNIIDKDDLYDKSDYGLEQDCHATILYGFHSDVNEKEVFDRITENLNKPIKIELTNISIFESKEYDVVKFDAKSKTLIELNKICKEFPHTNSFPTYHPHLTIAYVKRGKGKKYIKEFSRPYQIESNELVFSTKNKKQTKVKIQENIILNERKSEFEVLKNNKKPLTDEERKKVMDANAVWHFTGKPSPAVWKSVNSKGDVKYVTNTQRLYKVSKTINGAISNYHKYVKQTA